MDSEYEFYLNNPELFYNSSASFSFENGVPIATLSRGNSTFFLFEGSSIKIRFESYLHTGNAKIYIDGVLNRTYSIGTSLSYTHKDLVISGLSDGSHTLQIIAEGNTVRDYSTARDTTSNIIISSVTGVSTKLIESELSNFSFVFISGCILSLLIVSVFRIFGIFGGSK